MAVVGRPTEYKPEYCEIALQLLNEGASLKEIAYELQISRQCLYEWIEKHKKFGDTINAGKDLAEGWWLKQGRVNVGNKEFNASLFNINMKNRFNWSDKREVKQESSIKISVEVSEALEFLDSRAKDV